MAIARKGTETGLQCGACRTKQETMIVVGGGIIGLACTWRMAQSGIRVRLFDAREFAAEASWAAAGMLAPGGEIEKDSELARMAIASLGRYESFVAELHHASGLDIDYRRCGALEIALNAHESAELERRAAAQARLGIRSERVERGRFFPDDAVVDPRDVNTALKTACSRLGVSFHEREPVLELLEDGKGVRTTRSEYFADGVVLAAGTWASHLCPALPEITPVRGHLIAFEKSETRLDSVIRHGRTYLVPRASGAIIAGSSTEHVGLDRTLDTEITDDIRQRACDLMPELASLRVTDRWNGLRPHIEGEVPAVGRLAGTSIWAACGHYRNGVLLAPETAHRISASILQSA